MVLITWLLTQYTVIVLSGTIQVTATVPPHQVPTIVGNVTTAPTTWQNVNYNPQAN